MYLKVESKGLTRRVLGQNNDFSFGTQHEVKYEKSKYVLMFVTRHAAAVKKH